MKILYCQEQYDEKFIALTNCLHAIKKIHVASCSPKVDDDSLISFAPDLVLHNSPFLCERLNKLKILQIYIHNNIPVQNVKAINLKEIGPVVDNEIVKASRDNPRYHCDIVLVQNMEAAEEVVKYKDLCVRLFGPSPMSFVEYCGNLHRFEYPSLYRSAKVSVVSINEPDDRLFEIILSGGNPVIFDPSLLEKFRNNIESGLSGVKTVTIDPSLLKNCISVHKFPKLLEELGFKTLASIIKSEK